MQYLSLRDCLGLDAVDRLYYTHTVAVRNGMSSSDEKALSNLAVAFVNSTGGIVGTGDYLIAAQGSPNNTVQVAVGRAYVPTSDGTMVYSTRLDASANVTIPSNTSGSTYIDSIVLYIDVSVSPDATSTNVAKFASARGSVNTPPTNGQILSGNGLTWAGIGASNPYIILANVTLSTGFVSVTSGNISDQRTNAALNTGQTIAVPLYGDWTDQSVAPSTPASGKTRVFSKGSAIYLKNAAGGVVQLGSTSLQSNGNSTSAATVNWANGITQSYTLATAGGAQQASVTFTFQNPVAGERLTLILTQGSAGSNGTTLVWPGTVVWPYAAAPTLTTTAGAVDMIGFIWDGTKYRGLTSLGYAS